jgi:hypothetical protein
MRAIVRRGGVLAVLMAVLVAPAAHAQLLIGYLLGEVLSTPTFSIGFEVGANWSTLDGLEGGDGRVKPLFGLFADWRFSEHFHLGGSFLPILNRGATGAVPVPTGDPELDGQVLSGSMDRTLGYIEVPVLLKWAPKRETGIRVGAGPSFGLITSATDRYDTRTTTGSDYVVERDISPELPTFDLGLSVDVEYRLRMLSLALRYTHGFSDLRTATQDAPVRSRSLTGSGRIYLGRNKPAKTPPVDAPPTTPPEPSTTP